MDPVDGKSRGLSENYLAFKVPHTDIEIISFRFNSGLMGVVYNPLKAIPPSPWLGTCLHCRTGKLCEWGLSARRSIQLLCTAKIMDNDEYELKLPNWYEIRWKINQREMVLRVLNQNKCLTLNVIKLPGQSPIFDGPKQKFRSIHIDHALKLLLSARVPANNEVTTCLSSLLAFSVLQIMYKTKNPCQEIAWDEM